MKKTSSILSVTQILSISLIYISCPSSGNELLEDPFAQVFEGSAEEDEIVNDTGQVKYVGNLFPQNRNTDKQVSTESKDWKSIKGIYESGI